MTRSSPESSLKLIGNDFSQDWFGEYHNKDQQARRSLFQHCGELFAARSFKLRERENCRSICEIYVIPLPRKKGARDQARDKGVADAESTAHRSVLRYA